MGFLKKAKFKFYVRFEGDGKIGIFLKKFERPDDPLHEYVMWVEPFSFRKFNLFSKPKVTRVPKGSIPPLDRIENGYCINIRGVDSKGNPVVPSNPMSIREEALKGIITILRLENRFLKKQLMESSHTVDEQLLRRLSFFEEAMKSLTARYGLIGEPSVLKIERKEKEKGEEEWT